MTDHYYSKEQRSELRLDRIKVNILGKTFELDTASGVFSIKKLDRGSELLIKKATIQDGWDVLDLGCGYGAVGISIALAYPDAKITMSDVNLRAVKVAKMNAKLNRLDSITVISSDAYEAPQFQGKEFDTILLNPPQSAGKELCQRMISESKAHLKKGGLLQVVARHQKGGKTLSSYMEEVYGNVSAAAKAGGFRVYVSKKD